MIKKKTVTHLQDDDYANSFLRFYVVTYHLPSAALRIRFNLRQPLLVDMVEREETGRGVGIQGFELMEIDFAVAVHVEVPQQALNLM